MRDGLGYHDYHADYLQDSYYDSYFYSIFMNRILPGLEWVIISVDMLSSKWASEILDR